MIVEKKKWWLFELLTHVLWNIGERLKIIESLLMRNRRYGDSCSIYGNKILNQQLAKIFGFLVVRRREASLRP